MGGLNNSNSYQIMTIKFEKNAKNWLEKNLRNIHLTKRSDSDPDSNFHFVSDPVPNFT